jgi:predicted dehydrogenase
VTPPAAHGTVIATALRSGLAVLTEKPFADSLTEAVRLTGQARAADRLLMVSQSRRYEPGLEQLRGLVSSLGALATVTTEVGVVHPAEGFRAGMAQPLLWDMAVHAFDAVRLLTGARPVAVYCEAFNPPWSGFAGPATATAIIELDGGIRYVYTGSWCADGLATAWSGRWRVTGERGTAQWDGASAPTVGYRAGAGPETVDSTPVQPDPDPVAKPLDDFVRALRTGTTPWGEASDNLWTLAMAEAAVVSATTGRRVEIDEVLSAARRAAA